MKTFSVYRLLFTSLSPVHIGTGDSYEPTNYVIEGDTLHEFDTGSVVEALSTTDRQALDAIVNRSPDDTMIKAVQKFFHDRRATLMPRAVHRIPVLAGVARLYADRVGQTAQQESAGRRGINQLEINRTAYNPVTRLPVLMGSSVKGAIRTALLDQVNNGNPRLPQEQKGLHEFQGRLFRYYEAERRKMFLERDPMRLVQIGDAAWQGESGLPAAEIVFAVNRKKAPVVDRQGNPRPTRADSGLDQIMECVPTFRYRAFAAQLNVQLLEGVGRPDEVPDTGLRFDMGRIAQACNAFYRPILQKEIELLSQQGYLDREWGQAAKNVLDSPLLERGAAFLLRVGRHSGAESVTLNGVRKIKIMKGPGRPSQEANAATTVWLAATEPRQVSGLLPFGWMLVEVAPLDSTLKEEDAGLKTACDARLAIARLWTKAMKEQEQKWGKARRGAHASAPELSAPMASSPTRPAPSQEIWPRAECVWDAGQRMFRVTEAGRTAETARIGADTERDTFVAALEEAHRRKLLVKRVGGNVKATVQLIGGNRYRLVRVEPVGDSRV